MPGCSKCDPLLLCRDLPTYCHQHRYHNHCNDLYGHEYHSDEYHGDTYHGDTYTHSNQHSDEHNSYHHATTHGDFHHDPHADQIYDYGDEHYGDEHHSHCHRNDYGDYHHDCHNNGQHNNSYTHDDGAATICDTVYKDGRQLPQLWLLRGCWPAVLQSKCQLCRLLDLL